MLLNAKQHMELVRYIHETDSKCDNYYCNDSTFQSELKYGMGQPLTEISIDDLYFGLENRTVMVRGQEIELTAKEFDIFAILIMNPLRVFTYEMITDLVWCEDYDLYSRRKIINHISNIRKKLMIAPDIPNYIKSIHCIGYKFNS